MIETKKRQVRYAAKQSPHRPDITQALGLRAMSDGIRIVSRNKSRLYFFMRRKQ
jgi:hypothetical protein